MFIFTLMEREREKERERERRKVGEVSRPMHF
jgi:hypothetical protein